VSARIVPMDADGHQALQALLPWYATGRIDPAEAAMVEAHLAGCAPCRAELAWERKMSAAQATLGDGSSAESAARGLALLHDRIQAADLAARPRSASLGQPRRERRRPLVPWWSWVLGAQFAAIVLLTVLRIAPPKMSEPAYRALGTPAQTSAANLLVRFRPDAAEREIRSTLEGAGARLVDGPTVTGAYLLSVPVGAQAAALGRLRAASVVVLAESLDAGARP